MGERSIYLSGPMKGYPESNYPLFNRVAAELRADGHRVYNPAEFPHDGSKSEFPLRKAFAAYCEFICNEACTIVLLPGWEKSLGVRAELALAKNCGLDVIEYAPATSSAVAEGSETIEGPVRAKIVPFSSVVGQSVVLTDETGAAVAQISISIPSPSYPYRETAEEVACIVETAINEPPTEQVKKLRAALSQSTSAGRVGE